MIIIKGFVVFQKVCTQLLTCKPCTVPQPKKVDNGPKTFCNQIMLVNILLVAPHPLTTYYITLKNIMQSINCVKFHHLQCRLWNFIWFYEILGFLEKPDVLEKYFSEISAKNALGIRY